MRFASAPMITTGSMSGNISSYGISVAQDWVFSVQANYTGVTAAAVAGLGTMKLQISNDSVVVNPSGPSTGDPAVNVRNWCDYTGTLASTSGVAGSSTFFWNITNPGFAWVRLVYVKDSGTGILSANFFGKGT